MIIYTVVDNSTNALITTDRLKMLEKLFDMVRKYEDKQTWFWVDEAEIR